MYAFVSFLFSDAGNSIVGTGQAHAIYGASSSTKAKTQTNDLRGTGFIRYWLDSSRPSGAPQGHAGVAR
jgi:hypothetical protein